MVVPAVWSLIERYRQADRQGRLQLKWFAYAAVVFAFVGGIFRQPVVRIRARLAFGTVICLAFCAASTLSFDRGLGAILRHRLYDIDRIIGRRVYAGLRAGGWNIGGPRANGGAGGLGSPTLVLRHASSGARQTEGGGPATEGAKKPAPPTGAPSDGPPTRTSR